MRRTSPWTASQPSLVLDNQEGTPRSSLLPRSTGFGYHGIAAVRSALGANQLDEAERLLGPLAREFPQEREVQRLPDILHWRERQRLVVPAEDALRDVLRRRYRDDPEATVAHLASVQMDGLPDDLARRVFGLWSNACAQLVQQRGWHEPYRYAPATSAVWCSLAQRPRHRTK